MQTVQIEEWNFRLYKWTCFFFIVFNFDSCRNALKIRKCSQFIKNVKYVEVYIDIYVYCKWLDHLIMLLFSSALFDRTN